jgi:anhydro-N-acetylmuramic acid kinase
MLAKNYKVMGVMSGSSLDGLDLAICDFSKNGVAWHYKIIKATTIHYNSQWKNQLKDSYSLGGRELTNLDATYGRFIGYNIKKFLKANNQTVDFISSHGHTVFHAPDQGYTMQIGSGAHIAAESSITTINNYRTLDVALSGQGAPLVPVGDQLLFPDYNFCLNLGGYANVSYNYHNKRIAFDICPVNTVINSLMQKHFSEDFDKDGETGATGIIDEGLLNSLNDLNFYKHRPPKSLGREWLESTFWPLIDQHPASVPDKLRTIYEHIANQVVKTVGPKGKKKILVTGGGAYNKFLINRIKATSKHEWIIPDNLIVEYKEALIFAFLGVLRMRNEKNCLSSVTGATSDNIGGAVYVI